MRSEYQLIYRVTRDTSHGGYTTDKLWVGEYAAADAAERLAGTIDNKAGYNSDAPDGGAEVAARMGRGFAKLIADGHTRFYDWCFHARSFSIGYQVYQDADAERPNYCRPGLDLPGELTSANWALALLNKVARRIERRRARARGHGFDARDVQDESIKQMQDVIEALEASGAIRCEDWTGPADGHWPLTYLVPVRQIGKPARRVHSHDAKAKVA